MIWWILLGIGYVLPIILDGLDSFLYMRDQKNRNDITIGDIAKSVIISICPIMNWVSVVMQINNDDFLPLEYLKKFLDKKPFQNPNI